MTRGFGTKTMKNHLNHALLGSSDGKRDSSSLNRYVAAAAVLASTNSALLGYGNQLLLLFLLAPEVLMNSK